MHAKPEGKRLVLFALFLSLISFQEYRKLLASRNSEAQLPETETSEPPRKRSKNAASEDPLEPKTQGAVLLQSMLRLSAPHNDVVVKRYSPLPRFGHCVC